MPAKPARTAAGKTKARRPDSARPLIKAEAASSTRPKAASSKAAHAGMSGSGAGEKSPARHGSPACMRTKAEAVALSRPKAASWKAIRATARA